MERYELSPGYTVSRVVRGGWQWSDGHATTKRTDHEKVLRDMRTCIEAGITTFDIGDIYRGVEELVGEFVDTLRKEFGERVWNMLQIHTKYVPDLNVLPSLQFRDTEQVIDRSRERLKVDILDLVQFHWWDYGTQRYREVMRHLFLLRSLGKIRHIGVTNFDVPHMEEFIETGMKPTSLQVQYSLLDRRPENGMVALCQEHSIPLLCYGTVAGGFLSERYLGMPEPLPPFPNRSLTKYMLVIQEFGGWPLFQELLQVLKDIARKHCTSIAVIVSTYVLQKPQVAAVIIGAHRSNHIDENTAVFHLHLDVEDLSAIENILQKSSGPRGDVYTLERTDQKHSSIMQKNNNQT